MSSSSTTTSSRTRSRRSSYCCSLVIVNYGNYKIGRRKQSSTRERQKERAMTSEAGSTEADATLLRESVEAFNTGDMAKLLAVAAPDIVIHYAEMPEPLQGR